MPSSITVFPAKNIVTLDPAVGSATHVAVRNGHILEVGALEDCAAWGEHRIDDRFADCVLIPGFIESHAHLMEGFLWAHAEYVGAVDRRDPQGRSRTGLRSVAEVSSGCGRSNPGWAIRPGRYWAGASIRPFISPASRSAGTTLTGFPPRGRSFC